MLFPDAAIEILRQARWDPDAERSFELMSGGFVWSDEGLNDVTRTCLDSGNGAFRYVIAYRASLVLEEPRIELREPWDQLLDTCPDWPGFRPERVDPSLKDELEATNSEMIRQLERMAEVCERAERIAAIRQSRKRKWWKWW